MKEKKNKNTHSLKGIKPVGRPRFMADTAYDILREAIIKGTLVQGQKLVETQLSTQMNVSRVPIREAMKRLEQDGLVEKTDKRGFIVKIITKEEIDETFGIISILESYAAVLATERIDDVLIRKLEESVEAYRQVLETGDREKLMQLNTQFHEMICNASGSQKLCGLINNFRDISYRYRRALLNSLDFARLSLIDHEETVMAMRKKDRKGVERLIKKHILRGKEIILKEMETSNYL